SDGRERTSHGGAAPQRGRRTREDDAPKRGAGEEADLPRGGAQRHVAPDQLRRREVGDQRVVDGSLQALADAEGDDVGAEKDDAAVPSSHVPAASTPSAVPLKMAPAVASARTRLCPPSALANGSCARTSTSVLTKKMTPIPASPTAACSFTYGGSIVATCA